MSNLAEEEVVNESENIESSNIELRAKISAMLFASTKPLTSQKIADFLSTDIVAVENSLDELLNIFDENIHGFSLVEVSGAWQFRTNPAYKDYVQKLIPNSAKKLSRAASETLAVVAYRQPVQKAEIDSIRGVDSTPTLKTLTDAKLIRIIGHDKTAGHPALYGTTDIFLEKFGLKDLSELPSLRELESLESDPGEIEIEDDQILDQQ